MRINSKVDVQPTVPQSLEAQQADLAAKSSPVTLPSKSSLKPTLKRPSAQADDVTEILAGFESEEGSQAEDSSDMGDDSDAEGENGETEIKMDMLPPVPKSGPSTSSTKKAVCPLQR